MSETDKVVLKKRSLLPIVMFPYPPGSHTLAYTGYEFIKDIKFEAGFAELCLTERKIGCRLIFPSLLMIEIELPDITGIVPLEGKHGILEIRFRKAKLGHLTRFGLSGSPSCGNRVFLNLGDDSERWLEELRRRAGKELMEG